MEYYWKAWLALVVFGFAVPEWYAITRHTGNTLSEWVWRWFNVADGWSIERVILIVLCLAFVALGAWLIGHFGWMKWS